MVFYLYVIDARRHLVGVVSLRRLLLVPPETPLKRIMTTDLISVRVDTDQEEVARQVASYNLLAIPVVDEENKLVGVITVDDVIDVIKDEATEDVYRLAGVAGDDRVFTTAGRVAAQAAALADRQPGDRVSRRVGGRACSRARSTRSSRWRCSCRSSPAWAATRRRRRLTVIVRGIALGELTWGNSRKALIKEALVGLGNGVACGIVGAVVVWLFSGDRGAGRHPGAWR